MVVVEDTADTVSAEVRSPARCSIEVPLRAYGRLVGRFPVVVWVVSFLLCSCLAIVGWVTKRGHYLPDLPFEKEWSVKGGEMEREYDSFVTKRNAEPWENKVHITMFVGKNGEDIYTPEVLTETEQLYASFFNISVTTKSGKTYNTWDLCARGSMPDKPADFPAGSCAQFNNNRSNTALMKQCMASPYMPCKILSPNHCFSEYKDHLHPSYQQIDPVAASVLPASMRGMPYSNRPSYRTSTAKQMKQIASTLRPVTNSRGCPWYTQSATFTPDTWGASLEWNSDETELVKVGGFRWVFYMEGPRRAKFRMNITQPAKADEKEIKEALKLHGNEWQKTVEKFAAKANLVEVTNLKPDYLDAIEAELEIPPWTLIIVGGALMATFVQLTLTDFKRPLMSRVNIGMQGLLSVTLAAITSGGLILLGGMRFNSAMMAALPFLALGLGVNDTFVLIRYFSELVRTGFVDENNSSEILGELLAQAGAGVTLTSVCNCVAFAMGSMLPVPGMSDLCSGVAIVSAVNYFVVMTQFMALLVLEIRRIKDRKAEPGLGCLQNKALASNEPVDDGIEERFNTFLEKRVAPAVARGSVMTSLALIACVLLAVCCVFIGIKDVGYRPAELVSEKLHQHRALEMLFDQFTMFPGDLAFEDVDVPTKQREMLQLFGQISGKKHITPDALPPYLTMFSLAAAQIQGATGTPLLDPSWRDPALAPYGTVVNHSATFYHVFNQWRRFPLENPASAWLPNGNGYVYADMVRTTEFSYLETEEIEMSFFPFYMVDMKDDRTMIKTIRDVRRAIANSEFKGKAYPTGKIFTYWQVFIEMEPIMWRILGINVAVIFTVTLVLLQSPLSALVCAVACATIVLILFGICMLFLKFNVFIAASLLAAAGMSVEFTAHVVAAFTLEKGTLEKRLGATMRHTFVAIILGSLSTMIGILPMAFHWIPFIVKYEFAPFALAVAFGTLTGLVFLPAFLALSAQLGTCCCGSKSDSQSEKTAHN